MDINEIFGQAAEKTEPENLKTASISPFDFINAISFTKENLIVDEWSEKQYASFIVNRGLSFGSDTVVAANEMNSRPHLDKKLQFDFLINTIRPRKRYNKWLKAKKVEAVEIIKAYYGYSTEKAYQALSILSDEQLDKIKTKMNKGGV